MPSSRRNSRHTLSNIPASQEAEDVKPQLPGSITSAPTFNPDVCAGIMQTTIEANGGDTASMSISPKAPRPDRSEAIPMIDDDRQIIDITSGNLSAQLHRERFICPGINRECIEFNGMFITPKTFYHIADKASLKDWKNAIRINGKKIRWYIESGALDFFNHSELCTGRCKGRIPGKFGNSSPFPVAIRKSASPVVSQVSKINEDTYTSLPDHSEEKWKRDIEATCGFKFFDELGENKSDVKPTKEQLDHMMALNLKPGNNEEGEHRDNLEKDGKEQILDSKHDTKDEDDAVPTFDGQELEGDDDKMFWKAIVELGLVDEFFREIKAKLDVLKHSMIKNYVPVEDAKRASVIINELGMRDKLDLRLCAHKHAFDRQRYKLDRDMEELKKKVYEYEHKKDMFKRKSDCFEQLINKKPKLEDSTSRRKKGIPGKSQMNSQDNFSVPSPTSSRLSTSPGPSASQESFAEYSPDPSMSHDSLMAGSPGPAASQESLIEQSQSSTESGSGSR